MRFVHGSRIGLATLALGVAAGAATSAQAALVLADLGPSNATTTTDAVGRTWNNINEGNDLTGSPFTLVASDGADSGLRLTISNLAGVTNAVGFNGSNSNGTQAPTGTAAARNYPASATRDSLYGNTVSFNGNVVQSVRIVISNLNPVELYSVDFFASRTGAGGDNRETEYHVTGGNTDTSVFLNAAENTGNVVGVSGITPDANNQIIIDLDPGLNNTNANRFFYLGVLEINSIPEPGLVAMLGVGALAMLRRRRRA